MKAAAEPVPVSLPAPMPRQRSKPLLPVRGVMSLIDVDEDQVLRMVEEGELDWAWDVSSDPKRAHSKELRILPACVAAHLRGESRSLEWADVLRLLVPEGPVILSKNISRILNVSSTHLYNLARRKQIVPCSSWRSGPDGCARFPVKSLVQFLQTRRYP
jgi:hypothetical protein